ncbi:MAG: SpoIIE family protein phosphatase [candidate division Zixibacteria bacterium]|nr:SpoIIE family protein phosphatase [candidate division Zixibacteria bacterium]
MFRRPIKEISAEFQAEERHLDGIQRVVRDACGSAGMARKDISAVLLAIEEGATNIIRHAYLYEPGILRVRIVIYKKLITFSLIDRGRSFRPEGHGQLNLERLVESGRRGGLGFYMIQKIMDSVEYISSEGQNELRMSRHLGERGKGGAAPLLRRMFTLRFKFSLWTAIIVSIIIGGAFYFINDRTEDEIYSHLDGTAGALGMTIAEQAGLYMLNHRSDVEFDELVLSYSNSNPMLVQIVLVDSAGLTVAHSDDIHFIRKLYSPPPTIDSTLVGVPQRWLHNQSQVNYLILPILAGERRLGTVHLTYSSALINEKLVSAREGILKLTILLVAVGVIGIYLLSNYFVKPIVNITRRVRRFTSGDLDSELPLEGADEFYEISHALNQMMTRLRRERETAVERERMAKEIEVASQIQKTLLPGKLPRFPGLEVEAFYRAASMIGGDLYDVFPINGHRCGMVVADVSGKGVPASLVMSMLRTVIQIFSRDAVSARTTLQSVNEYLSLNMPPGMFITVLMAIYDSRRRVVNFVSAGHNPLLLYTAATRKVSKINPAGMPLGMPDMSADDVARPMTLEEVHVPLQDGDVFIAYTDGITEAHDRNGEQYGLDRLIEFVESHVNGSEALNLTRLSHDLVTEIDTFVGATGQRDDMTFVIGRATPRNDESAPEGAPDRSAVDTTTVPTEESDPDSAS